MFQESRQTKAHFEGIYTDGKNAQRKDRVIAPASKGTLNRKRESSKILMHDRMMKYQFQHRSADNRLMVAQSQKRHPLAQLELG
jgi:hypothetical protein